MSLSIGGAILLKGRTDFPVYVTAKSDSNEVFLCRSEDDYVVLTSEESNKLATCLYEAGARAAGLGK